MSYFNNITKNILDAISKEIQKPEVRAKIMTEIVDPALAELSNKYKKYIILFVIVQVLIVILLFYIVYLIKTQNKQ